MTESKGRHTGELVSEGFMSVELPDTDRQSLRESIDAELSWAIYGAISDGRQYMVKVGKFTESEIYRWRTDEIKIQRAARVVLFRPSDAEIGEAVLSIGVQPSHFDRVTVAGREWEWRGADFWMRIA